MNILVVRYLPIPVVHILVACLALVAWRVPAADIAPVVSWTVNTERREEKALELVRGETVILQATFKNDGAAINLGEATSVLLRYTADNPATNSTYLVVTGAVYNAAGGVARVRWTPAAEDAQDDYFYELAVMSASSTVVRARGPMTLLPGVGDSDAAYAGQAYSTIDWASVQSTNPGSAPFIPDPSGEAVGAILYKGAGGWTHLAPGTSGYLLSTAGTGSAPAWVTAGAGDVTGATSTDGSLVITSATGPVPDFALPATLPARSGANLTALNASNLASGTVPDARFPATLPALSGANLTALNASNLASGTVPDARFPATLPALSGANLTALNASNISSGTLNVARIANGSITDAKLATTYLPANAEPADSSFGWPVVYDGTTVGKLENISGVPNLLASDGVNPYAVYTNALPAMPGAALTTLNASALSTGTVPAARLGEQRLLVANSGWHLEAGSSTVGWFPFVSAPVHGYCAKSAATTLQTFTLASDPVAVPYAFAAYKTTGAVKIAWTADDTDATDAKIVGITLYGATDLTGSWTALYADVVARNASSAGALQAVSIPAADISALTGLRYLMAEVDCQLRSNAGGGTTARCLMVYSMEVFSQ